MMVSVGLPHSPGAQASYSAALPQYTAATAYAAQAPQQFPIQQPRQLSPQPMQPAGAFPGFPQLQAGGNPPAQLPPAGRLPPFQAGIVPVQPSTALEALQALRVKQEQKSSAVLQQPSVSRASEDDYYEGLTAEELPLKPVNKRKMDFSSERLKVQALFPLLSVLHYFCLCMLCIHMRRSSCIALHFVTWLCEHGWCKNFIACKKIFTCPFLKSTRR